MSAFEMVPFDRNGEQNSISPPLDRGQRDEYEALRRRLSESQERELIQLLNGPEGAIRLDER
jgi:hypothetical protein